jgi:hypothetical protein
MKTEINLPPEQFAKAACVGLARRIESVCRGRTEKFKDYMRDGWTRDIEGALAEAAVRMFYGVEAEDAIINAFGKADLHVNGHRVQVRHSRGKETWWWAYRDEDPDWVYVMTTGGYGTYCIEGIISGAKVREACEFSEARMKPCYEIRRKHLSDPRRLDNPPPKG